MIYKTVQIVLLCVNWNKELNWIELTDILKLSVWKDYMLQAKGPLSSPGGVNSVTYIHTEAKHDHRCCKMTI